MPNFARKEFGTLPGSVAMKAQKIDLYPNSLTVASQRKTKNTRPARLRTDAIAGAQARLIPQEDDKTRQAQVKILQAQIDADTYHVDSTDIAQQMLESSMACRMLDVTD